MKYENITEGRFPGSSEPIYRTCGDRGTDRDGSCKEHRQMQGAFDSWCPGFSGKEQ